MQCAIRTKNPETTVYPERYPLSWDILPGPNQLAHTRGEPCIICHQYTCVPSHMHTLLTLTLLTHLIDVGMCFEGCVKSRVSHCFAQHVLHDNQKVHISQRLLHPWVLQPRRAVQQLTTVPYCHTVYSSTSYSITPIPTFTPTLTAHTSHPHLHSHPPTTPQPHSTHITPSPSHSPFHPPNLIAHTSHHLHSNPSTTPQPHSTHITPSPSPPPSHHTHLI